MSPKNNIRLEKTADIATRWIGSTSSLLFHTVVFILSFLLPIFNLVSFERMLLVLTTVVSLEAIYLSIFIQMTVNKNSQDIEIIQEDIEDIEEGIGEIQKDVDEIQEDVVEMQEDTEQEQEEEKEEANRLVAIQALLVNLQNEIASLKKR
jgi:low affinity Fe/Cu permease